jgi:hypothetical protein
MNENEIGSLIIDTAVYLHKNLGPGLLESVYETVDLLEIDEYKAWLYSQLWGGANERRDSENY